MSVAKWVRTIVAAAIIGFGILWSIMFPKTSDILRPDFVASVALGLGLMVTGLLIFFITKSRSLPIVLLILLLWSALFNIGLYARLRYTVQAALDLFEAQASNARYYLRILESSEEDNVERLAEVLKRDATETFCLKEVQQGTKVDVDKVHR
jgi:hypothetical protein